MHRYRTYVILFLLVIVVLACGSPRGTIFPGHDNPGTLVRSIDNCDDFSQQFLALEPHREVVLLVHGCKASSGRFLTLKKVFESRGQQAICFNYDYRDRMDQVAGALLSSLRQLSGLIEPEQITIIGHSQGGLVARRALIEERPASDQADIPGFIRLVTISTPFNGIRVSRHCGSNILHILSGGLTVLVCQGIAGATWPEIHPRAAFINQPGTLIASVTEHLKIVTDERGTCRRRDRDRHCLESDFIFSLEEQYHRRVDDDLRVKNVEIQEGHALVVGIEGHPPYQLLDTIEQYGVLQADPAVGSEAGKALLSRLY